MSAMTLEQVRNWARNSPIINPYTAVERANAVEAIDAHITAHAQMVEKVREVIENHRFIARLTSEIDLRLSDIANGWADKLAQAIGDAK